MFKLSFLFICLPLMVFAQNINGVVYDFDTSQPLEGVNVFLSKKNKGTTTNKSGEYYLNLYRSGITERDTIYFSYLGYETLVLKISDLIKKNNRVFLNHSTESLNEVVVQSKYLPSKELKYQKLASMPNALQDFGALMLGDKIYVLSGNRSSLVETEKIALDIANTVEPSQFFNEYMRQMRRNMSWEGFSGDFSIYDLKSDSWDNEKKKFIKRGFHNVHLLNDKFYILGGKRLPYNTKLEYLQNKIEVFDLKNNIVEVDETNPHMAVNFASFTYGDFLFTMGGSIKKKEHKLTYTNKVHIYDGRTGLWHELDNLPIGKEMTGILVGDYFYVVGGFKDKALNTIEKYSVVTGKWTEEARLPVGIAKPGLATDEKYIFTLDSRRLYCFDVITKEVKVYTVDLNLKSPKLFYRNNTLYVLGGYPKQDYKKIPSNSLYSIDLSQLKNTKSISL